MYTLLLCLFGGVVVGAGLRAGGIVGIWGSVLLGTFTALAAYGLAAWRLKRMLGERMAAMQQIMADGQKMLQQRVNMLQSKPTGNPTQMLQELQKTQRALVGVALAATVSIEPFLPWVPLLARQLATIRMQFQYQLENWDEVDKLLPRCLLLEPVGMAMRLAHLQRRQRPIAELRKTFDRSIARLKYNQGALLYALMAWIYLRHGLEAEAHKVLVDAAKHTENETIKRNLDRLANGRAREFSNAGLGDEWYALYLEQPKVTMRRQNPRASGRPF